MDNRDKDILIHPRRGKKEALLPETAIIVANPAEARTAHELMRCRGIPGREWFNSRLAVDSAHRFCLVGPALGASTAGLIMEKLIVLGVRNFCLFSCCGAINQEWGIGDIVIAISGVSGEGVSQYYGGCPEVKVSSFATQKLRELLSGHRLRWKEGGIWSTDAPYRESRSMLERLHHQQGVGGVDMEFTALCSVASFRGVNLSALFIVSDELWREQWKPGFSDSNYKGQCKMMISKLIEENQQEFSRQ